MEGGDVRGAGVQGAEVRGAKKRGANMRKANLEGANLQGADLEGADLEGADLRGANLRGASLRRANLREADLEGANLRGASLEEIKKDFQDAIMLLPNEINNLRAHLIEGKIDGSSYEGECSCLAGTIAKHIGKVARDGEKIAGCFPVDSQSPRERWFLGIEEGDTPENSQICAITLEWIDEVLEECKEKGLVYDY